jgi:hypothetical protein
VWLYDHTTLSDHQDRGLTLVLFNAASIKALSRCIKLIKPWRREKQDRLVGYWLSCRGDSGQLSDNSPCYSRALERQTKPPGKDYNMVRLWETYNPRSRTATKELERDGRACNRSTVVSDSVSTHCFLYQRFLPTPRFLRANIRGKKKMNKYTRVDRLGTSRTTHATKRNNAKVCPIPLVEVYYIDIFVFVKYILRLSKN